MTVHNPGGNWQPTTLEDLGCGSGGTADWAVGTGVGESPPAAMTDLVRRMKAIDDGGSDLVVPERSAPTGYTNAPTQTWIVMVTDGRPSFRAVVVAAHGGGGQATAHPDRLCGKAT